jgi:DNA-binding transcriptional ArsR family regulator
MQITDPQAIRALAHPLRLDLLELLNAGPATAAECARSLGSSQANCSFHLRQLAKYGFVGEAPAGADRRERRWRLLDHKQSWSSADPAVTGALSQVFARREADRLIEWAARAPSEPVEWRTAATLGGATIPLTVPELDDVVSRYAAIVDYLITAYGDRLGTRATWPAGARPVRLTMAASPFDDSPDHSKETSTDE